MYRTICGYTNKELDISVLIYEDEAGDIFATSVLDIISKAPNLLEALTQTVANRFVFLTRAVVSRYMMAPVSKLLNGQVLVDKSELTPAEFIGSLRSRLFYPIAVKIKDSESHVTCNDYLGKEVYSCSNRFTDAIEQIIAQDKTRYGLLLIFDTALQCGNKVSEYLETRLYEGTGMNPKAREIQNFVLLAEHGCDLNLKPRDTMFLLDYVILQYSNTQPKPMAVGWLWNDRKMWYRVKTTYVREEWDTHLVTWKAKRHLSEQPMEIASLPIVRNLGDNTLVYSAEKPVNVNPSIFSREGKEKVHDVKDEGHIDFEMSLKGHTASAITKETFKNFRCQFCSDPAVGDFKLPNGPWAKLCINHVKENIKIVGTGYGQFFKGEHVSYKTNLITIGNVNIKLKQVDKT